MTSTHSVAAPSPITSATVVIVGHSERAEAGVIAQRAEQWLRAHGHRAVAPTADALGLGVPDIAVESDVTHAAALVLSIGGDGTMLRAIAMLGGAPIPVLGVNVGLLGYLTEVEPDHVVIALERFFAGDYILESRLVLDVTLENSSKTQAMPGKWRALNEASFEKMRTGQTIRFGVSIDGVPFTTFQADGLLVATPTGSTAYSLSARGPIVSPTHQALLLTPLAPHMLFDRSLVLSPDQVIRIEVVGPRPVGLAIDGQEVLVLQTGQSVICTASDQPALFVRLAPQRFHQILKTKFGLADR